MSGGKSVDCKKKNYNSVFCIASCLKIPNKDIKNLSHVVENPSGFFINIAHNFELQNIKNAIDIDYLEGAIILKYQNKIIIGFDMYDLIDQLWSYILDALEKVYSVGYAELYFPDQPIKISMQKKSPNYLKFILTIGDSIYEYLLPLQQFVCVSLRGAETFFMSILKTIDISQSYYASELEQIKQLKKYYDCKL